MSLDVFVASPDEKSILTYISFIKTQFPVMPPAPNLGKWPLALSTLSVAQWIQCSYISVSCYIYRPPYMPQIITRPQKGACWTSFLKHAIAKWAIILPSHFNHTTRFIVQAIGISVDRLIEQLPYMATTFGGEFILADWWFLKAIHQNFHPPNTYSMKSSLRTHYSMTASLLGMPTVILSSHSTHCMCPAACAKRFVHCTCPSKPL